MNPPPLGKNAFLFRGEGSRRPARGRRLSMKTGRQVAGPRGGRGIKASRRLGARRRMSCRRCKTKAHHVVWLSMGVCSDGTVPSPCVEGASGRSSPEGRWGGSVSKEGAPSGGVSPSGGCMAPGPPCCALGLAPPGLPAAEVSSCCAFSKAVMSV